MSRETIYTKVQKSIAKTNPSDFSDYMKNFDWAFAQYKTPKKIEQALRATV